MPCWNCLWIEMGLVLKQVKHNVSRSRGREKGALPKYSQPVWIRHVEKWCRCHISVYAATCYIAIVGSAAPDQLPHFRRLHVNVEVRLLFRSVLGVRLTSTAFPQLKPCFYNKLMPYQWICTSVASTHSCAGDGVMMSECLFVCPEAVGFMYSPQIPKNQHAKRLKCIRLNQICDGDWLHIEIFRCVWFATNWKLLFFPSREAAKLPPADIFPHTV